MPSQEDVRKIKELHKMAVLALPNVVGVGIGYKVRQQVATGELSVVALVRRKVPQAGLDAADLVPASMDGVVTDVVEVGDLRPLQSRSGRWRPAPGGVSVGHVRVTAGTLGCVVLDRATGERLILSNNHVLANSNESRKGDSILQPGAADGGREPEDVIARLERFSPIHFNSGPGRCGLAQGVAAVWNYVARLMGSHHRLETVWTDPQASNQADAALARPVDDRAVQEEILEIGRVTGTTEASLGMGVRKSGRSTGLTTGEVTILETTVDVSYGPSGTARFEGQMVTTPMSSPGDSGSLLVAADSPLAVGLLFAGSDQASLHNPIGAVLDSLQVRLG
jgi:hypothetical protein